MGLQRRSAAAGTALLHAYGFLRYFIAVQPVTGLWYSLALTFYSTRRRFSTAAQSGKMYGTVLRYSRVIYDITSGTDCDDCAAVAGF